jgi:hypothetical protein
MRRVVAEPVGAGRIYERWMALRYRAVAPDMCDSMLDLEVDMRHNVFDKSGPGMVGVVLCYIAVVCLLAAVFYVFGL